MESVLIVDDNPLNLKLTQLVMVNGGYHVRVAQSAEEALELLPGYHPDLILMDIQLPGMDGLELTRKLKTNPATNDIVIVALTASAMKGTQEQALETGCDGYITKPIDTRTLVLRIKECLHSARLRS